MSENRKSTKVAIDARWLWDRDTAPEMRPSRQARVAIDAR